MGLPLLVAPISLVLQDLHTLSQCMYVTPYGTYTCKYDGNNK